MKYYLQYPIRIECQIRCSYCFHRDTFSPTTPEQLVNRDSEDRFTVQAYKIWRDTHLRLDEPESELIVHFHGGEPSTDRNAGIIKEFAESTSIEKLDILTNGLGGIDFLTSIPSNRYHRIGFTFHREWMERAKRKDCIEGFFCNLLNLHKMKYPVYFKEMLIPKYTTAIIRTVNALRKIGIPCKIQDFKGYDRGEDYGVEYTLEHFSLIDEEYIQEGRECCCLKGYKNIIIRGGWMDGDILSCWKDPVVVGNVRENTYNPNALNVLDYERRRVRVDGVPRVFRGTYNEDRYMPQQVHELTV